MGILDEPPPSLEVEETEHGLGYWRERAYLSAETRERLDGANVILVPREEFRGESIRAFPQGTEAFFDHLTDAAATDGISVDLAIDDDEYVELALHSDTLRLATIVVSSTVLPVALGVVANFVTDWLRKKLRPEDCRIETEIVVTRGDELKAVRFRYAGPADEGLKSVATEMRQWSVLDEEDPK